MSGKLIVPQSHKPLLPARFSLPGAVLLSRFCTLFGDDINGARRLLGGLMSEKPSVQWYCKNKAVGRYRMHCPHGHTGQIMEPCMSHLAQFRTAVKFCPACNRNPVKHHRCNLVMEEVH